MKDQNYNFEIRTLLEHFAAAFNDVKIRRFDGEKLEKEIIKVPFTYAPKSHILSDIIGLTDTIRLPIMAVEIKSQGRDNERVKNKIQDIIYKNDDGTFVNLKVVPWNISVQMSILAKFQEDLDQIVQNFAIYNDPYIVISWKEPKSGRELRTEILWDGVVSYEYPGNNQGPTSPPFRVTASTGFTVKGYVFRTKIENSTPICLINTDYTFTDKFYCKYDDLINYTKTTLTDSYAITGRPLLRYVSPYYIVEGQTPKINVNGYSFGTVNAIFLSGSNPAMYPLSTYQPFSALNSFDGYPVKFFEKSDNTLSFTLPAASADGFVDIIAVNTCGYGKLTEDSNRCSRVENPYPVDSPEHYSWSIWQYPYMNGLIMANFFDPYLINNLDQVYSYHDISEPSKQTVIEKIKEIMTLGNITDTNQSSSEPIKQAMIIKIKELMSISNITIEDLQ